LYILIKIEKQNMMENKETPGHILIAEDEAINRLFIRQLLERKGFEVTAVSNGREAVDTFATKNFKLILIDVGMPVLDGIEATRAIRAQEASSGRKRTPIIALTAYTHQSDIESGKEAGMDDYIIKPLKEGHLFRKIEEWTGDEIT
jgi:CheY-like chemotaxis protein